MHHYCTYCLEKARAFIPVNKIAKTAAAMAITACVLCGAAIGPPAVTPVGAAPSVYVVLDAAAHPVLGPADHGEHEPPHPAEAVLTADGSAATYSATAPTARVYDGLPSAWPVSSGAAPTMVTGPAHDIHGMPPHAMLPPYGQPRIMPATGPHGAATSTWARTW
jgi:hypothetical protein